MSVGEPSSSTASAAPEAGARVWTPKSLLEWTERYFRSKGIATPRLDAELLLAHALGVGRLDLYLQFDRPLAAPELTGFRDLVRRRGERVPVAYLTGEAGFWSLTLDMAPGCLIPRPDTETLVEAVLAAIAELRGLPLRGPPLRGSLHGGSEQIAPGAAAEPAAESARRLREAQSAPASAAAGPAEPAEPAERLREAQEQLSREAQKQVSREAQTTEPPAPPLTVLELGTGSAAIPLAVCSETRGITWIAVERSPEALAVATRNRVRHASLLGPRHNRLWLVRGGGFAAVRGQADLMVSNPPYIPSDAVAELMPEVSQHEPRAALDGGADGLAGYRLLLPEAADRLRPGGRLLVELGHDHLQAVRGLAAAHQALAEAGTRRDLAGHVRVLDLRKVDSGWGLP